MARRAVLLALLCAATARAEATDEALARHNQEIAVAYYERGEFTRALDAFREAYRLAPLVEIQFNIGRTCEQLGRWAEARTAYRAYLAGKPDAADHRFVEARVAFLDEQIAAGKAAAPQIAAQAVPLLPAPAAQAEAAPPDPGRSRAWRIAGWSALGAGAAATIAGVWFGRAAAQRADDLAAAEASGRGWSRDGAEIDADGRRDERIAIAALVTGGVAIAAGVAVLWIDAHRTTAGR